MSRVTFNLSLKAMGLSPLLAATLTLCGCGDHGRLAIPDNAERLISGSGSKITAVTAAHAGRLHVLDRDDDSLLWAGDVGAGQILVIDGLAHKVLLDGKTVATGLVPKDHYVVFLSQPK